MKKVKVKEKMMKKVKTKKKGEEQPRGLVNSYWPAPGFPRKLQRLWHMPLPGIGSPPVMVEAVPVAELPTEGLRNIWMNKKPCLLTSSGERRADILSNNSDRGI